MINIYESIDRIFEKELAKKVLQEDLTEVDFEDALNELYTRISTYLDTHDCFKVSLLIAYPPINKTIIYEYCSAHETIIN